MARKPERDPLSGSAREERVEPSSQDERLGPLAIERLSKQDGRALIVYRATETPAR